MLRDGKFIKETPPKIGSHYIPPLEREYSEEEQMMQEINLGHKPQPEFKSWHVVWWMIGIYSALVIFGALIR